MKLSVSTADMQVAYKQLCEKGASQIANVSYGPGSGAKWLSRDDPDGNRWCIVQSKYESKEEVRSG
jgi:hypothetical protein